MIEFDVSADFREVERMIDGLPGVVEKAANRALNKTASHVLSQAAKRMAPQIGIKQSAIKRSVRIKRSIVKRLIASLTPQSIRAVNLIEYKARKIKGGVSAAAWGKRKAYKKTFIIKAKNGKRIVVSRKSLAVRVKGKWKAGWSNTIYGPSIPLQFAKDAFTASMKADAKKVWAKNFNQQLKFYLDKA